MDTGEPDQELHLTPAEMEAMHPAVRLSELGFVGMMSEEEVQKFDYSSVLLQIGDSESMLMPCEVCRCRACSRIR